MLRPSPDLLVALILGIFTLFFWLLFFLLIIFFVYVMSYVFFLSLVFLLFLLSFTLAPCLGCFFISEQAGTVFLIFATNIIFFYFELFLHIVLLYLLPQWWSLHLFFEKFSF